MVYRNGSPLITTLQVQSVNLTWDAYQALPSTKLTDGVYYNITDLTQSTLDICNTLSGENTLLKARVAELESKNVYSTDEKVVGTWIDGKPIYRRSFNNATGTLDSNQIYDKVINFCGYGMVGSVCYPLNNPKTSAKYTAYINASNQLLGWNDGYTNPCLWVDYTKTTD